uniref:Osteoclast associated Ig-like receptor n=1 Tax=Homo sapiens TaxID=9606 RepID=A0A0G2JNK2_HUMAN
MALVLILQLLTLWPLCHTDITPSAGRILSGGGDSSPRGNLPLLLPKARLGAGCLVPAQRCPGAAGDRGAAAAVAGGAARAGGGSWRQREPALRGPPAEHELRAVPRGRGGPAAVPPLRAALGRLHAAGRPRPRHLQLLLSHALRALRAVAAQRGAGHQLGR